MLVVEGEGALVLLTELSAVVAVGDEVEARTSALSSDAAEDDIVDD